MVFLFPGVLFRKFYFSGQFGNQFEQGNLLERFLWSLFLSLICLNSVSYIFSSLNTLFEIHLLEGISFDKITSIFKNLAKNEFPISLEKKNEFQSFLVLIFLIYFISGSLGYLANKLVVFLYLDRFSFFKFKNKWHYLSQAYEENGVNRKIGDVHTTFVDILVKNSTKDQLYSGIYNNFILDKENKLENIVLSNAYKFVAIEKKESEKISAIEKSIKLKENIFSLHRDYLDKKVFKKSIDGNLFVLSNENIININFTYVKTSNNVKLWKKSFYDFLRVSLIIVFVGLVIIPFLKIDNEYFFSASRKLIFSMTTFLISLILLNVIGTLLKVKINQNKIIFTDLILILSFFGTPYLWIFNLIYGIWVIPISLVIITIFAVIQNKK